MITNVLRCICITLLLIFSWLYTTDSPIVYSVLPIKADTVTIATPIDTIATAVANIKPVTRFHKRKPVVAHVDIDTATHTDTVCTIQTIAPSEDTTISVATEAEADTFCYECLAMLDSATANSADTTRVIPDSLSTVSHTKDTATLHMTADTTIDTACHENVTTADTGIATTKDRTVPHVTVSKKIGKPIPATKVQKTNKRVIVDPVVAGITHRNANKKFVKILEHETSKIEYTSKEAKFIRQFPAHKFLDSTITGNKFLTRLQKRMKRVAKHDKNVIPKEFTISQYLQRLCAIKAMRKTWHQQIILKS